MPFMHDIYVDEKALRHPLWGTFEVAKGHIEEIVVVNLLWSLNLIPLFIGWGFSAWPLWIRLIIYLVSLTTLAASTGVLYGLMAQINQNEPLTLDLVRKAWQNYAIASMQKLAPLFGIIGLLVFAGYQGFILKQMWMQVGMFSLVVWLLLCAMHWGPQFVLKPERGMWKALQRSFFLVAHHPLTTLGTLLIVLLLTLLGIVSIGGIFLIVPALIALFQIRQHLSIQARAQKMAHA